jgi:hypothetical protein
MIEKREFPLHAIGAALQMRNNTAYDHHPPLFRRAAALVREHRPHGANILSFGCASGAEAMALADKYFTLEADRILGLDIDPHQVAVASHKNRYPNRVSFAPSSLEVMRQSGPFDAIFAVSVLCRWPATKGVEDIAEIFPFATFCSAVAELDSCLTSGGLLVIYNANFRFSDTPTFAKYRQAGRYRRGGKVAKFDRSNKRLSLDDADEDALFVKLVP